MIDAPDDQTVAVGVLRQASQGNLTTQTMRAFSEDEFAQIVSRLP
ncbi:MAG: GYD domain-containing protein [Bacteroidetes bacterium]|nr:GYD domain-containing protein [Bacteroidota bacterium]MCL5027149.1 GYD domain-containing protein [Chloroflexota bacterium]